MELYCAIRKVGGVSGQGKYSASLQNDTTNKHLASGGFPTIVAAKRWAQDWAKAKKAKLVVEVLR